jgi:CHAD domain-containing protein
MRYRILSRELPETALRRIAREAVRDGLLWTENVGADPHEAIHEVRKVCTKVRSLLRLFRPAFGAYSAENDLFRDLARGIAELRDATSLIECCDALASSEAGEAHSGAISAVREALVRRRNDVSSTIGLEDALGLAHARLEDASARVETWFLDTRDLDTVAAGFHEGYRRARKWVGRVSEEPTQEKLHEWRKSVKVHRNHLRVLRPVWPSVLGPRHKEMKRLADRLGEEHDLAVLGDALRREPWRFDPEAAATLTLAIERRRGELQDWVLPEGRRLFEEKPKAVKSRMRKEWEEWLRKAAPSRPFSARRDSRRRGRVGPR